MEGVGSGQDLRNKLCLAWVLTSQIHSFKRLGLNLYNADFRQRVAGRDVAPEPERETAE